VAKSNAQGGSKADVVRKKKKIQVDVSGKVFVKATFNNVIVQGFTQEYPVRRAGVRRIGGQDGA
jgi:hypothetical protein